MDKIQERLFNWYLHICNNYFSHKLPRHLSCTSNDEKFHFLENCFLIHKLIERCNVADYVGRMRVNGRIDDTKVDEIKKKASRELLFNGLPPSPVGRPLNLPQNFRRQFHVRSKHKSVIRALQVLETFRSLTMFLSLMTGDIYYNALN